MQEPGPLTYKGWKSTRLQLGVLIAVAVTAGYIWGDVTAEQWINFLIWDFGAYAVSEIGSKGATAYKERGQ